MRIPFIAGLLDEQRRMRNEQQMRNELGIRDGLIYEHDDVADLFLRRCCDAGIEGVDYMREVNDTPITVRFRNGVVAHLDNTKVRPSDYSGWLSRGSFHGKDGELMFSYVNSQPSIGTMHRFHRDLNDFIASRWLT